MEHLAKGLFYPKLFDLIVLDVDVFFAKGIGYLEDDKGISEVILVLVGGDIIYFVEMAAFDANDVSFVLASMSAEWLNFKLLAFNKDTYSKFRDALVLTRDLHTIFDDLVIFEGS